MINRITSTRLAVAARGSSVRVVVAADKYTVANISEGMNDREDYAALFAFAPQMLQMLRSIGRMTAYEDYDQAEDAFATMNALIENARNLVSCLPED